MRRVLTIAAVVCCCLFFFAASAAEETVSPSPEPSTSASLETGTPMPEADPSPSPSVPPSLESPSQAPPESPTPSSSPGPTISPSPEPTTSPSPEPTISPSPEPTATPSLSPTAEPSPDPTETLTPAPTATPQPSPSVLTLKKKALGETWLIRCDVMDATSFVAGGGKWTPDLIKNPTSNTGKEGHRSNKCGNPDNWVIWVNADGIPYRMDEIKSGATGGTLPTVIYRTKENLTAAEIQRASPTDYGIVSRFRRNFEEPMPFSEIRIGKRLYWTTSSGSQVWCHSGVPYKAPPTFILYLNGKGHPLISGQSVEIADLLPGIYELSESPNPSYYLGSVSSSAGNVPKEDEWSVTIEIPEGQRIDVDWNNVLITPHPGNSPKPPKLPEITPTPSPEPTATPTPEPTSTPTQTPTPEPTNTPTTAPTSTQTPEPSSTPTPTATPTPTPMSTQTPETMSTPTPTNTPAPTPIEMPTQPPQPVETPTREPQRTNAPTTENPPTTQPTPEQTRTPQPTRVATPTPAPTRKQTPRPTATPEPATKPHPAPTKGPAATVLPFWYITIHEYDSPLGNEVYPNQVGDCFD